MIVSTSHCRVKLGSTTYPFFSAIVLILPYLDEQEIYDQISFDPDCDGQCNMFNQQERTDVDFDENTGPQSQFISAIMCPSDNARGRFMDSVRGSGNVAFAKANVAFYASPVHIENQAHVPAGFGQGVPKV